MKNKIRQIIKEQVKKIKRIKVDQYAKYPGQYMK